MDFDYLLRLGQFVFTVLVGLFSLLTARRASSKAQAEQLATRLNSQDNRILVLEQQLQHMPDARQFAELAGDVKAMKAEMQGVARELGPLRLSLERMNDYLLNSKVQ